MARARTPHRAVVVRLFPMSSSCPRSRRCCWPSAIRWAASCVLSFQEFGLAQQFGKPPEWVGLDNYRELLTDPYLWRVTLRTVVFCLVNAAVTMVRRRRPRAADAQHGQRVRLLAADRSAARLGDAGRRLADGVAVALRHPVRRHQLPADPDRASTTPGHSWLLQPLSFFFVATVIVVWMSVPFVAFTVYAALTQVPEELVEAAEMDGAGRVAAGCATSCCRRSARVLLVVGLLQVIWDLRVFTQIYILQEAGGSDPRHQPPRHLHLPARHRRRRSSAWPRRSPSSCSCSRSS